LSNPENTKESPLSEEKSAKKAKVTESTATGDDKITIMKHKLFDTGTSPRDRDLGASDGAELAIRNVSDSTIATVIFEAAFYDIEGNIIDTAEHKETDLKPRTSRAILIFLPTSTQYKIKSYNIRVIRTVTADVEKVQLRGHAVRTNEAGEEEVKGAVKNLSNDKADAVLVAAFYNPKKESIGNKAIILRDIEPDNIKQFHFRFKPQEGDIVRTYNLKVVCDIDE
jgi:hypothetical protein